MAQGTWTWLEELRHDNNKDCEVMHIALVGTKWYSYVLLKFYTTREMVFSIKIESYVNIVIYCLIYIINLI